MKKKKKLGYTWYPKDYISDPQVIMMDSSQRGIYRDLIDLAYMESNVIKYTIDELARYCAATPAQVQHILDIKGEKKENYWTIPNCKRRMDLADTSRTNGQLGGRPKNPEDNLSDNPEITQGKRQREREREKKGKEGDDFFELEERVERLRSIDQNSRNGFKAKAFHYWEQARDGYSWHSIRELQEFDHIKRMIADRIKQKDPKFRIKDIALFELFKKAVDQMMLDDFYKSKGIEQLKKNLNQFLDRAKEKKPAQSKKLHKYS